MKTSTPQAQQAPPPMVRKPILMPPEMVSRVDQIAKTRKVSFAEVVRNAVDSFNEELGPGDEAMLESMADMVVQRIHEVAAKIDKTIERLDETHDILEAHHGNQ